MSFTRLKPEQSPAALPLRTAGEVAARLGVDLDALADLSGIDRRVMRSDVNDPFVNRLVSDIVRAASIVNRQLGSIDRAYCFLYRRPMLQLDGRTALEAICLGHADAVIELLTCAEDEAAR